MEEPERLQSLTQEFYPEVGRRVPVHLELRGTEPPNGHGPGLGVQRSSDFELAMRKITSAPTAGDFLCILRHALLRKKNTEA